MEPKNFDNLQDEFNLQKVEVVEPTEVKAIQRVEPNIDKHLDADYEEIRTNLKDIIKRGAEAIDGILLVASETQQPRAYEVVATLIKSVSDVNKDLLTMHKQMQDIKNDKPESKQSAGQITNNSIFVGSTSDLQALIKGRLEQIRHIDQ
jgi:hypothetical protein